MTSEAVLRDLCESVQYGYTETASSEPIGPKFLRGTDIKTGSINWDAVPYCKIEENELGKYKLEPGDIVITRMGSPGDAALIDRSVEAVFASYLIRIRLKPQVDPNFAFYFLRSPAYRSHIRRIVSSSTRPSANARQLTEVDFPSLDLADQKKVGDFLSVLDKKIDLNRRLSNTLAEIGQALFKRWFVDFEFPNAQGKPYKSSDGRIVEDESGIRPHGWSVEQVGDAFSVKGGTTPSTKREEYWNGDIYWATPKDLSTLEYPVLLDTERRITKKGLEQIGPGLLKVETVLLSSRAPIGYLAVTKVPVAVNQGIIAMEPRSDLATSFMKYWVKQNLDLIKSYAGGSTFQEISKGNFKKLLVALPPREIADAYNAVAAPLEKKLEILAKESLTLIKLRDSLLPRLLSGSLEVSNAH